MAYPESLPTYGPSGLQKTSDLATGALTSAIMPGSTTFTTDSVFAARCPQDNFQVYVGAVEQIFISSRSGSTFTISNRGYGSPPTPQQNHLIGSVITHYLGATGENALAEAAREVAIEVGVTGAQNFLRRDGTNAMAGDLDLGGNDILGAGNIDGAATALATSGPAVEIDGTPPSAGQALVATGPTGAEWQDITTQAEVDAHIASTSTHGVTGSIVGTGGAQTITGDKSFTSFKALDDGNLYFGTDQDVSLKYDASHTLFPFDHTLYGVLGSYPGTTGGSLIMRTDWNRRLIFAPLQDTYNYTRIEFRPEGRTGDDNADVQFVVHSRLIGTADVHRHFSLYTTNAADVLKKRWNVKYKEDYVWLNFSEYMLGLQRSGGVHFNNHIIVTDEDTLPQTDITGGNPTMRLRRATGTDSLGNVDLTAVTLGAGLGMRLSMYVQPDVATEAAEIALFRSTTTSGNRRLDIYKGDGSNTIMGRWDAANGELRWAGGLGSTQLSRLQHNHTVARSIVVPDVSGTVGLKTAAPATAASTGVEGQFAEDDSFLYICTATDTWKRVAIATW